MCKLYHESPISNHWWQKLARYYTRGNDRILGWSVTATLKLSWFNSATLPPERTQPQKLCTANFSSGTLKTLINRLLRLKNKIFWRAPCEKKPFFSRLKSDSQKYILKWSYWPEILAPGLKLIFMTTLFSNFYHFTQPLPSWGPPLKWGKGGILAQNDKKLTSEGLKCLQ